MRKCVIFFRESKMNIWHFMFIKNKSTGSISVWRDVRWIFSRHICMMPKKRRRRKKEWILMSITTTLLISFYCAFTIKSTENHRAETTSQHMTKMVQWLRKNGMHKKGSNVNIYRVNIHDIRIIRRNSMC